MSIAILADNVSAILALRSIGITGGDALKVSLILATAIIYCNINNPAQQCVSQVWWGCAVDCRWQLARSTEFSRFDTILDHDRWTGRQTITALMHSITRPWVTSEIILGIIIFKTTAKHVFWHKDIGSYIPVYEYTWRLFDCQSVDFCRVVKIFFVMDNHFIIINY